MFYMEIEFHCPVRDFGEKYLEHTLITDGLENKQEENTCLSKNTCFFLQKHVFNRASTYSMTAIKSQKN